MSNTAVLSRPHKHKLVLWRRGFPLKLCACGHVEGIRTKVGQNTIDVGAAGVGDLIRWSGTQAALAAGDIGQSALTSEAANGRMSAFIETEAKSCEARGWELGIPIRRSILVQQNAGLTTLALIGISAAPVTSGTASVVNVSTGEGQFVFYTSAAVSGSNSGIIAPTFDQTRFIYRPIIDCAIRNTNTVITNLRSWVGVFSGDPRSSATPAVHLMGFRYDTAVDGTTWQAVTDNGSGTPTVTNTTVTFSATTSYRLRIVVDGAGANVRFYINGILRATHTTTLPTTTQDLGYCASVQTTDAVAKGIRFGRLYIGQKSATLVS
jgi:hypothetical protein